MNVRNGWFVAGLLSGCAAGAVAGLLVAPMPGRELVASLRAHVRRALDDARQAGQEAEADVLTRYQAIRTAAGTPALPAALGLGPVTHSMNGAAASQRVPVR